MYSFLHHYITTSLLYPTHSLRRRTTVRSVSFKILFTTVYNLSIYKIVSVVTPTQHSIYKILLCLDKYEVRQYTFKLLSRVQQYLSLFSTSDSSLWERENVNCISTLCNKCFDDVYFKIPWFIFYTTCEVRAFTKKQLLDYTVVLSSVDKSFDNWLTINMHWYCVEKWSEEKVLSQEFCHKVI